MQHTRTLPPNELERLSSLFELDLDYTSLDNSFKDLSYLAAKITGTEISLISFIDSYTQWVISKFGLDISQTAIEDTVCQYTILENDHLEIEDLSNDVRFSTKAFVGEPMNLKYYLGIPLKSKNGFNVGSLCVIDKQQHKLSADKIEQLKIIADQIIVRINDMNAIKSLEKKLSSQTDAYQKISHDIRGPIAGIIGLAEMINDNTDDYSKDELHDMVGMMGNSGQSVLDLADEILKNALETKAGEEIFNLKLFKEKLDQLYQPQAFNKEITLDILANKTFNTLQIRKDKLLQISGNLISNAIKFTSQKGSINVGLDLVVENDSRTLILTVKDTGKGIEESDVVEILKGTAESSKGTIGEKGFGLGLPTVKKLIEELNGTMSITSTLNVGTFFEVKIPFV